MRCVPTDSSETIRSKSRFFLQLHQYYTNSGDVIQYKKGVRRKRGALFIYSLHRFRLLSGEQTKRIYILMAMEAFRTEAGVTPKY